MWRPGFRAMFVCFGMKCFIRRMFDLFSAMAPLTLGFPQFTSCFEGIPYRFNFFFVGHMFGVHFSGRIQIQELRKGL